MSAAVACSPASPTHLKDACIFSCTGQPSNDVSTFDATKKPSETPIVCYMKAVASGQPTIKTPLFTTDSTSAFKYLPVIFAGAGTYTLTLNDSADDSVLATTSVTVS
jgi:hypothetical protein